MKLGSKKKLQKILWLRISIGVLVVFCLLLVVSVYERYTIERDMSSRRIELETEYQKLQERKAALESRVEYLDDDSSIEAEIRRSFDVAREGEQVVIILDDDEDSGTSESSVSEIEPVLWYQFWR